MTGLDQNWIRVIFGVPAGNVLPSSLLMAKTNVGVNNPDLTAWVVQQAILLPDGFPRFVFIGWINANNSLQLRFQFQGFRTMNETNLTWLGIYKFDEIIITAMTSFSQVACNGYLVDRLIP